MAYGLQDVVNQRRMIDESPAGEEFKQVQRGKLDALLALAEAIDCRRVRLLRYFGETYAPSAAGTPQGGDGPLGGQGGLASAAVADDGEVPTVGAIPSRCGNCDNCLSPAQVWDGTEAARMLLSTIYRVQQASRITFGAGYIMDIVRGKQTEKVAQHGHASLSTFGIGAEFSEQQLRGVLRQLIAIDAVHVDAQAYNTLALTDASRAVLKGQVPIRLRLSTAAPADRSRSRGRSRSGNGAAAKPPTALDATAQHRYEALRSWRAEVAKARNLPAYVIFHDATLAAIAQRAPQSLDDLQGISGIGAHKLEAYGDAVLQVVAT